MSIVTVSVVDSTTNAIISGATVFLDGVPAGQTASDGTLTISNPAIDFQLSVSNPGYNVNTQSASVQSLIIVYLIPSSTPLIPFTLTVYPEPAAVGIPVSVDSANQGNYNTGGLSLSLTSGSHTFSISPPGYNTATQSFNTNAGGGTITLSQSTDPSGTLQPQSAGTPAQPTLQSLLPKASPTLNSEFIAPNTTQGTYLTMTQARLYIGNLFIDELNFCQYTLQANKVPVYGYASTNWDGIMTGKSLVQGQFGINFISEGYLYLALNEYASTITAQDQNPATATQDAQTQQLGQLLSQLANPDPLWTAAMISAAQQEVSNLAGQMTPTQLTQAKTIASSISASNLIVTGQIGQGFQQGSGTDPYGANAVYQDVPFDILIQFEGAGRTITRRLEQCILISNDQILDQSGAPIIDTYGFIARRLR